MPSDKVKFFQLVAHGDAQDAVTMMNDGHDVNAVDELNENWTALHYAAYHNRGDLLRHLMYNKADANATDVHGNTALHIAAYRGAVVAAGIMMQNNVEIDMKNKYGYTALHYAAGACNARLLGQLLDKKADANVQDEDGWTALHWASYKGSLDSVRMLLKKDASPDVQDKEGLVALDIAALTKQSMLLKQSLSRVTSYRFRPGGEKPSERVDSRKIISPRDAELKAQRLAGVSDQMTLLKARLEHLEQVEANLKNEEFPDQEGFVFLVGDPVPDGGHNFLVGCGSDPEAFVARLLIDNASIVLMDKVDTKRCFEAQLRVQDLLDAMPSALRLRQSSTPSVWWYQVAYKDAKSALETAVHDQQPPVEPELLD